MFFLMSETMFHTRNFSEYASYKWMQVKRTKPLECKLAQKGLISKCRRCLISFFLQPSYHCLLSLWFHISFLPFMSRLQRHLTPPHIHFHVYFSLTCLVSPCSWNCDSRLLCLCELCSLLFSFTYIQLQYPSSLLFHIYLNFSPLFCLHVKFNFFLSVTFSILYLIYALCPKNDFCLILDRTEFSCTVQVLTIPHPVSFRKP
jgi:hypothetical protein